MRSKLLKIGAVIALIIILYSCINNYFGWYAYKQWDYRRCTRGEILESKERKVFVKNLNFQIVPNQDSIKFNCYIERGYTFGKHNMETTKILENSKYPYQVSLPQADTLNKIMFKIRKNKNIDSMDLFVVYLKENKLVDTIYIDMIKQGIGKIGVIKVFD